MTQTTIALDPSLPHNPTTGANYQGNNVPELLGLMDEQGWTDMRFAGYVQWQTVGRQVPKGTSGTVLTKWFPLKDKKTGKPVIVDGKPKLGKTTFRVWNIEQTVEADPEAVEKAKQRIKDAKAKGKTKAKTKRKKAPRKKAK